MIVLVSYDISVKTKTARKRYRKVLKICKKMGTRIQKSVFECRISRLRIQNLQNEIEASIDRRKDLILFVILKSKAIQQRWIKSKNRKPRDRPVWVI